MANNNDSYEELLKRLSAKQEGDVSFNKEEAEVKNNGEIYFSGNGGDNANQLAETDKESSESITVAPAEQQAESGVSFSSGLPENNNDAIKKLKEPKKKKNKDNSKKTKNKIEKDPIDKKKKKKKRKDRGQRFILALLKVIITISAVVLVGALIKIPIMNVINDILAIDGTRDQFAVTVNQTLEYDEVIDLLCDTPCDSRGTALKVPFVCKFVAKFMGFDEYAYPPGTYYISTSMGLEGMLQTIASAGNEDGTVTLTFPEGYTVDQIAEKLELNGVCSKKSFFAALDTDKVYERYDFLAKLDRNTRYHTVEGYLYPDTYEFYVGEDAYSVIFRFIDNFSSKMEDEFADALANSSYSLDEIVIVASILEKEAKDSEQMPLIASIIYNRLESGGLYQYINCDSTAKYLENSQDNITDQATYNGLMAYYDTYKRTGLPAGAISNPGSDALYAALHPDSTSYFYFCHDKEGKIYVAKTGEEHAANQQYIN